MGDKSGAYVLLTAARNEAQYIPLTLEAVAHQPVPPLCWIIVSDGSTDATDEIVGSYAAKYPFIRLIRRETGPERTFGSKARAINQAFAAVRDLPFGFVGILDADVSFAPDYYQGMLWAFAGEPDLGVAGGLLYDKVGDGFVPQITSREWSVSGPVQMFRRECFEAIGGYQPVQGGVDAVAEVMARMKGWRVRTFPAYRVLHHRKTSSAKRGVLDTFYHRGREDYLLGYHPLFFLLRTARHLLEWPWVAGAVAMLAGYTAAALRRLPRSVSADFVAYLRREQCARVRQMLGLGKGAA